ncbi:hypothetical protein ASZ90_007964 [hydrocarbon metagenome]|uniref:Uncharacterized protein n=1 Tax=hydrocarbon metagenome TaxID=938273 RepID=A0A0W8FMT4_9ZZZZ
MTARFLPESSNLVKVISKKRKSSATKLHKVKLPAGSIRMIEPFI